MQKSIILLILFLLTACASNPKTLSTQNEFPAIKPIPGSTERFAQSLSYPTFWPQHGPVKKEDFIRFHQFLQSSYPQVYAQLEIEAINELSLLYKWKGSKAHAPAHMIIAHFDVVPAENPKEWQYPPFAGTIQDGYIWGRGAIDDKFSVTATLEALESLIQEGFTPSGDFYLALGHDEEIMGVQGAKKMAQTLKNRNVKLASVLDEGPNILKGLLPQKQDLNVAYIGIATKGHAYLKIKAKGPGGHSSMPPENNPIKTLSQAMQSLNNFKPKQGLTPPLYTLFSEMAPLYSWPMNMVFENPSLFSNLIQSELAQNQASRSLIQEDISFNMIYSGNKDATVPQDATLIFSSSLLPGSTYPEQIQRLKAHLKHLPVELETIQFPHHSHPHAYNPTASSSIQTNTYALLKQSVAKTYGEIAVLPTLMPGGSDGKHYKEAGLAENIYYFNPIFLTSKELDGFHGINERLSIDSYQRAIAFYYHYIKAL